VIPIIFRNLSYNIENEIITVRDRLVTVENLTPILTDEEILEQRQAIENDLFDIFEKYQNEQQM